MKQPFHCGPCNFDGEIDLPQGLDEDALTVLERVRAMHECAATRHSVDALKDCIVRGEWPHTQTAGVLN